MRPTIPSVRRTLAAAACAGGLLLGACARKAPADTGVSQPVSVQADWYAEAEQGGFYQALARGFYAKSGVDVSFMNGGPSGYPFQKAISGSANFALGRSDDVILAVSRGHVPLTIVCAYMEHDPMAVIVHEASPVRDFPDLAGKSVMADPSSAWISYLKAQYRMDFWIIPLNYGLGGFMADPNFIVQGFTTNEPYFVKKKGVTARALLISGSGYDPYRVVYANAGFVRDHPEAVRAFVAATIQGWEDFMHGDPSPGRRLILGRNSLMSDDFMDFSTEAMRRDRLVEGDPAKGERIGLMTRRRMQAQVDVFVRLKIIPAPVPLGDFVRFDFLPPEMAAAVSQ